MTRMLHKPLRLTCAAALLIATPALGHHSHAMFDSDREITLEGTVTELQWNNPHIHLYISVMDENGQAQNWALEGNTTTRMIEQGWPVGDLKPGDEVTVVIRPLRGGARGGLMRRVTFQDGFEFVYLGGPDSNLRGNPPAR